MDQLDLLKWRVLNSYILGGGRNGNRRGRRCGVPGMLTLGGNGCLGGIVGGWKLMNPLDRAD